MGVRQVRGVRASGLSGPVRGDGSVRDFLAAATGGEVLALTGSRSDGGEWDFVAQLSTRDRRRLAAAGFTHASGLAPDVLAEVLAEHGHCVGLGADEAAAWFCAQALAALDSEHAARSGSVVAERPDPWDDAPVWARTWVAGLIYEPKAEFAREYVLWLMGEGEEPARSGRGFEAKVAKKAAMRWSA